MIGGGIIGLEMATVYDALGSKVTVVELLDQLIPGGDPDLVKPLQQADRRSATRRSTSRPKVERGRGRATTGCASTLRGRRRSRRRSTASWSPSAAGPTARRSALEAAGVDGRRARLHRASTSSCARTSPHIYAIGDVVGEPMLAHKATHEGKVAAEVIAGENVAFDAARDPVGRLHRSRGRVDRADRDRGQGARASTYEKAVFPWAASGRALAHGPPGRA